VWWCFRDYRHYKTVGFDHTGMASRTRQGYAREYATIRNSRGFSAFPTELLHHVVSHIEGTTVPWYQSTPSRDGQRNKRKDALRALCQICRSLRIALLPLVWQSLEAYTLPPDIYLGDGPYYVCASQVGVDKGLLGQLRLVHNMKQPYALYVRYRPSLHYNNSVSVYHCQSRTITVVISTMNSLKKLARAMTLMPNLHTIHIMQDPRGDVRVSQFQVAFSGLVFRSVRCVIVPVIAPDIFASFPEVVEVLTNQPFIAQPPEFLHNMISHCPKVECIGWREFNPLVRYEGKDMGNFRRMYTSISMTCA
jgi:hypothetical protein